MLNVSRNTASCPASTILKAQWIEIELNANMRQVRLDRVYFKFPQDKLYKLQTEGNSNNNYILMNPLTHEKQFFSSFSMEAGVSAVRLQTV